MQPFTFSETIKYNCSCKFSNGIKTLIFSSGPVYPDDWTGHIEHFRGINRTVLTVSDCYRLPQTYWSQWPFLHLRVQATTFSTASGMLDPHSVRACGKLAWHAYRQEGASTGMYASTAGRVACFLLLTGMERPLRTPSRLRKLPISERSFVHISLQKLEGGGWWGGGGGNLFLRECSSCTRVLCADYPPLVSLQKTTIF